MAELEAEVKLNEYFDKVLVINLDYRHDKWRDCVDQFSKFGIEYLRVPGVDVGKHLGNDGCTAAHRKCLDLIIENGWNLTLILEDDFLIVHDDFNALFAQMIPQVPTDWKMLYLGGHYQEPPVARITPNVIRIGRMMTTSSYAVTLAFAKHIQKEIQGVGPIDTLYYESHRKFPCYIFQPRLMVQKPGFSDIQQRFCDNQQCMEDNFHQSLV